MDRNLFPAGAARRPVIKCPSTWRRLMAGTGNRPSAAAGGKRSARFRTPCTVWHFHPVNPCVNLLLVTGPHTRQLSDVSHLPAVDEPVVVRERHVHHGPDLHLALDGNGPLHDGVHAQDGGLRRERTE